jgi:hypothetical protein
LTACYLWWVECRWNLAKYFNQVGLQQLRRSDQFQELCPCDQEDRPFRYPSPVRGVPEPNCKTEIYHCGKAFFHLGRRIPVCQFEGFWRIALYQTIARHWIAMSRIPVGRFAVIRKPMDNVEDGDQTPAWRWVFDVLALDGQVSYSITDLKT